LTNRLYIYRKGNLKLSQWWRYQACAMLWNTDDKAWAW